MATIKAYRRVDTRDLEFHGGDVERNTSRTIVIDNGVYETTYKGNFSYSIDGEVFGRVESISQEYRGRTLFTAEDVNSNAHRLTEYYLDGDTDAILPYILSKSDRVTGSDKNDHIATAGGRDTVAGGDGNDVLLGGRGVDTLRGGDGKDQLEGGEGADELVGGRGDDTYKVDGDDRIVERADGGRDVVLATESFKLSASIETLTLLGRSAIDGTGNSANNRIDGNAGRNVLEGGGGNDRIDGGAGRDILVGGSGSDKITGGGGEDVFRFVRTSDLDTLDTADRITDFSREDRIDLSRIDADLLHRGNEAFDYVGRDAFSGDAGELRSRGGIVAGDVDGDGRADFFVEIDGWSSLPELKFLL